MDYSLIAAGVTFVALIALTYPLARRAAVQDGDPGLVRILLIALVLKLLASMVRYWVIYALYDGSSDAGVYLRFGEAYAEALRQGDFGFDVREGRGGSDGTIFIRQVTGWVMFFTGPSRWAAFYVFSWFSFIGMFLFHRAYRLAYPEAEGRRYTYLLFFLPTMLYWPSSVGKEAWLLLTLGVGTYGAARLLNHARGGYLLIAAGLLGSAAVRPHMTVLLAAGLATGYLVRRSSSSLLGPFARIVGTVLVLGGMVFAVQAAEERFGVEGEGVSGATQVIEETSEQTSQGGSEFEAATPGSLRDIPYAIFTVMFRPLPFEAHNAQALVTSFEGVFLLVLVVVSWRRLRRLPRQLLRHPYLTFAATFSLGFMIAFASFGNFGILARQRSQLFPFVLVLLAIPLHERLTRGPERQSARSGRRRAAPVLVHLPRGTEDEHAAAAERPEVIVASGAADGELGPD